MQLREYQGKELFQQYGIPVPSSVLLSADAAVEQIDVPFPRAVVKAQVLQGKRKKHGLITAAAREELKDAVEQVRGNAPENIPLLLEEELSIAQEHYLSFSVNRASRSYTLLYSEKGGIDIEQVAEEHITQIDVDTSPDFSPVDLSDNVQRVAERLFDMFREEECLLAEVNPLIETTDGDFVAADAKVILDDNALYRHQDRDVSDTADRTPLEQQAHEQNLQFVELDGEIGVIGNGAGLVLATLDLIDHYNASPANFLDIGGGADTESMEDALEIVLAQEPRGVFINVFGGITHCDLIAQGIVEYMEDHHVDVPVVVRMIGTNQEEGRDILERNGIHAMESMEEAAEKIVTLTKEKGGNGDG